LHYCEEIFENTHIITLSVQRFLKIKNVGKIKNVNKRVFYQEIKNVYKRLLQLCKIDSIRQTVPDISDFI